jgi:CBS domain-containing protein
MERCQDVMTKSPICCLPDDSVVVAAHLMMGRDIGAIPVIHDEMSRKLVGIVTDRDLAMEIVAEGRDPQGTKVEDVMTRGVVTCHAEDDLQMALEAMSEHRVRRIPVVDHENRIVGIIAQADVATRMDHPEKTAEVVKDISQSFSFS